MKSFILLLSLIILVSCGQSKTKEKSQPGIGIVLSNRDTTVRPGDDFFRYVNGSWLERAAIPADRGSWGSFNEVRERNSEITLKVLQEAAKGQDYPEGTDQRKAADFFSVGMDSTLAEKAGSEPIKALLDKVGAISSRADVQSFLTENTLIGGDAFFSMQVFPDLKNSARMATYLGSGGIGLPERDYYLKQDPKSKETRDRYVRHIVAMFRLAMPGIADADKRASDVLQIETLLATASMTKEDKRDPVKQYNKKSIAGLSSLATAFQWPAYFQNLGIKEDSVIVAEPLFIKEYDHILATIPMDQIKSYLQWSVIRAAAPYLDHAFVLESFDFNLKFMNGVDRMRPRWKRVLEVTDQFLGEAIGKLYVAKVFPPEAKKKALEMVDNIRLAFADRIKKLDWMSDTTKKMALNKLSKFNVKIGYPDKWKNYAGLKVEKGHGSYYGNILNASRYQIKRQIDKLGKPVDRTEWGMTPQTVNAYYSPIFNEIVFPAGILQPPFYNYQADEAVNYGAMGAVIGHELSHGFDDQGSQFDASGNLKNWWSAEDLKKFHAKGASLAAQFDQYEPLPGLKVQGQFTLGENIGDLGGLNVAYEGLQRFYREHNLVPGLVDGLTSDQRFFMAWASQWRTKYKDESLRTQVQTNPHSPGVYRANGPVSNMPEFYRAFNVKPGDKMYRADKDRVKIW